MPDYSELLAATRCSILLPMTPASPAAPGGQRDSAPTCGRRPRCAPCCELRPAYLEHSDEAPAPPGAAHAHGRQVPPGTRQSSPHVQGKGSRSHLLPTVVETLGLERITGKALRRNHLDLVAQVGLHPQLMGQTLYYLLPLLRDLRRPLREVRGRLHLEADLIKIPSLGHGHLVFLRELIKATNYFLNSTRSQEHSLHLHNIIRPSQDSSLEHAEGATTLTRLIRPLHHILGVETHAWHAHSIQSGNHKPSSPPRLLHNLSCFQILNFSKEHPLIHVDAAGLGVTFESPRSNLRSATVIIHIRAECFFHPLLGRRNAGTRLSGAGDSPYRQILAEIKPHLPRRVRHAQHVGGGCKERRRFDLTHLLYAGFSAEHTARYHLATHLLRSVVSSPEGHKNIVSERKEHAVRRTISLRIQEIAPGFRPPVPVLPGIPLVDGTAGRARGLPKRGNSLSGDGQQITIRMRFLVLLSAAQHGLLYLGNTRNVCKSL